MFGAAAEFMGKRSRSASQGGRRFVMLAPRVLRSFALAVPAALALAALAGGSAPVASAPAFGGVPVAVEFGKHEGDLSPSEIDFIAHNVRIAALEHFGGKRGPYQYQEDGVYANAAKLKAVNPSIKVLEYWGFAGAGHMNYRAYTDPRFTAAGESWYATRSGEKHHRLDITNPVVRAWWAAAAAKMVGAGKLDGLFIDGAMNKPGDPWRDAKIELFKELRADLDALGQGHKYVVINGNAQNFVGSGLAPYVDGIMIEWFDLVYKGTPRPPERNLEYLQAAYAIANSGKQVWLKAWPYPHNFIDKQWNKGSTYEQKVHDMREPLAWNVAAYLVSAGPNTSFLSYSWGYAVDSLEVVKNHDADASTWNVDPAWYAELKNDYGRPLGPMQVDGMVVSRRYPGGIARVDLAKHTYALPAPVATR
jgi:hypothetical protein